MPSLKRKAPVQQHKVVLPVRRNVAVKKQRTAADSDPSLRPPQPLPPLATLPAPQYLHFTGSRSFRDRLVLSTLSARPVRIDRIRALEDAPGLRDYEVSFLRLLELISVGSKVIINETGTALKYIPGTLQGGDPRGLRHTCPASRGLGYWLQPLLLLAPFCRVELRVTLTGCTNHADDITVDMVRAVTIPLATSFGLDPPPSVQLRRRAFPPVADGEVVFSCPVVKQLTPVNLTAPGLIRRVRGIAATARCSPLLASSAITAARGTLNRLLPDVHITADHAKGKGAGLSPGFALTLYAQSTSGVIKARELSAAAATAGPDVGAQVAAELLAEVSRGGCVDSQHEGMVFMWMCCSPEAVSRVRVGRLSSAGVEVLRLCELFFGVRMELTADSATDTVLVTAMGSGFVNMSRKTA